VRACWKGELHWLIRTNLYKISDEVVKHIQSKDSSWPKDEWIKRTQGNDWVYYTPGIYTGLREALYTYARFLDLKNGERKGLCQKFEQPWLICNTRFSEDAVQYSKCVGLNLVGWDYPNGKGLRDLMEKKKIYPITMMRKLDRESKEKLALSGLVLISDLIKISIKDLNKITKIPVRKLKTLVAEAKMITYG